MTRTPIIAKFSLLLLTTLSSCFFFLTTPTNADPIKQGTTLAQGLRKIPYSNGNITPLGGQAVRRQLQEHTYSSRQEKLNACLQQYGCPINNQSFPEMYAECKSKEHIHNVEPASVCISRHFECQNKCSYQSLHIEHDPTLMPRSEIDSIKEDVIRLNEEVERRSRRLRRVA